MRKNSKTKSPIVAYTVIALVLAGSQWFIHLLLGGLIDRFVITRALWEIACGACWWVFFLSPVIELLRARKLDADSQSQVIMDAHFEQIHDSAEKVEEQDRSAAERDSVRNHYAQDIKQCLADCPYSFYWAGESVNRIYLYKDGEAEAHGATLVVDGDDRITAVDTIINGKKAVFKNAAYAKAKKAADDALREPIDQFLAAALPDAVWQWGNMEHSIIVLSSKLRGFGSVPMKVHFKKGTNEVSSLIGEQNGKQVRVVRPAASVKKQAAGGAAPATNTTKGVKAPGAENCTRDGNISRVKAADIAVPLVEDEPEEAAPAAPAVKAAQKQEKAPAKPAPAPVAAATASSDGHLDVTADPPISDDVAKSNATLIADSIVDDLAVSAFNANQQGEDSFAYPWPEGIQTLREAEFLAAEIISRNVFRDIEVDANRQILVFQNINQ